MTAENEEKRPTLRDLAQALNIHYTTVGKALNNHPRISQETRDLVQKKARELGYRPNPLVSALMAHKKATSANKALSIIAVVVSGFDVLQYKVIKVTCASMESRARELGFSIEYFSLEEYGYDMSVLCRVLYARGIPSLLLTAIPAECIRDFTLFERFCCVSIQEHYGAIPAVMVDHFQCMELLCRSLAERGFYNPGLIITPSYDGMGMDRVIGAFRNFSHDVFKQPSAPVLLESQCDPDTLQKWLKKHQPDILIESWRGLRRLRTAQDSHFGLTTPQRWGAQVAKILAPYPYVLLDCIEDNENGISQNRELSGRKAIDVLSATLHRNERGLATVPHRLMVEGSLAGKIPTKVKNKRTQRT